MLIDTATCKRVTKSFWQNNFLKKHYIFVPPANYLSKSYLAKNKSDAYINVVNLVKGELDAFKQFFRNFCLILLIVGHCPHIMQQIILFG